MIKIINPPGYLRSYVDIHGTGILNQISYFRDRLSHTADRQVPQAEK